MSLQVNLFWFRRDLRLHDNAGLYAALTSGLPVVPVFIFDEAILSSLDDKDDKRVSFIFQALERMQQELNEAQSTFDVRYGSTQEVFKNLIKEYSVNAVYTNHDYEPYAAQRDTEITSLLLTNGVGFHTYKDQVIFEKKEVVKDNSEPYSVFTPYSRKWKAVFTKSNYKNHPSEKMFQCFYKQPFIAFPSLKKMGFQFNATIPSIYNADADVIKHYHQTRNTPSVPGTTRMGVQLRFGTVSIRQLVSKALQLNETYLNELIWREFFMQILWHHPRLINEACKKDYDTIKWRNKEEEFEKWCKGETGFPIVDAGMRELNETGFMHNRVRMIAGSFLVKDLLIDWRWGEAYFARKLLDFELSSNNGNWQWVAGCGCDAAPYFRVFNPALQAKKFDPKFSYIEKWVPEFNSPDYARPIVQHDVAKQRCIKAYKTALQKEKM